MTGAASTPIVTKGGKVGVDGNPEEIFSSAPILMFTAIREASRSDIQLERATFEAITKQASKVSELTRKEVSSELAKIISAEKPAAGLKMLDMAGILELIFPELTALKGVHTIDGHGHKDNFEHTLKVVDNISRMSDFAPLRWVALVHDIGKPVVKRYETGIGWTFRNHDYVGEKMVRSLLRKMKIFNPTQVEYISRLVGLHMRPQQIGEEGVTDSAVRRMITDTGDTDDLQDLMMLAEADLTSKNPVKVKRVLETFAKVRRRLSEILDSDTRRNTPDLINGYEIMETLGIGSTPELGRIKSQVTDYAETHGLTHAEAYQYMIDVAKSSGFRIVDNVEELREKFEQRYVDTQRARAAKRAEEQEKKSVRDAALGRKRK